MKTRLNWLILGLFFLTPTLLYRSDFQIKSRTPANFASANCRDLVRNLIEFDMSQGRALIRTAFGMETSTISEAKHVQFGFESEYGLSELEGVLGMYAPDPRFGISHDQWLAMQPAERVTWVQQNVKSLFPDLRSPGGLIKMDQSDEWKFLPDALILDDTNNVEFVLKPFDTFEQWYTSINKMNARFGPGSMQGTVSVPTESFFGKGISNVDPNKVLDEKVGMFNFYSDYDIIQKLNAGYLRYQRDPSTWTARNFDHPFLGPMNQQKQSLMHSFLRGNAIGEKYEQDKLKRISSWVNSFKFIGGTTYRPDILGQKRVVLEIRDAHKNFNLLMDRMTRQLYFMQKGTAGLDKFKDLKSFDHIADFEKFPSDVQEELIKLFPNKADPRFQYDPDIKKHIDSFRNFAFPLRDWTAQMNALGAQADLPQVRAAQDAYLQRLSDLVVRLRAGDLDANTAKKDIQAALAQFVHDSKIAKAYENYEDNFIFNPSSQQRFMREIAYEAGPARSMFPQKFWTGPLTERMEVLLEKYPRNIRLIKDVPFKFKDNVAGKRNIYAISMNGMDQQTLQSFKEDYFKAVSENTISFPLKQKAGHLYTRVGNNVVDFYFGSNVAKSAYEFPTYSKLETFFEFEPDEFLRFREYMENGTTNGRELLGSSGYDGVKGSTGGRLNNNRAGQFDADGNFTASRESHNCTSWLCTAPVGDNGEAIHDLAGAPRSYEVHTNPGWWTMWLVNYGKKKRSPFAVYYSDESLDSLERTIREKGHLDWDFDVH